MNCVHLLIHRTIYTITPSSYALFRLHLKVKKVLLKAWKLTDGVWRNLKSGLRIRNVFLGSGIIIPDPDPTNIYKLIFKNKKNAFLPTFITENLN